MPGQSLRLGPFIGGINTLSDASAIADAELVECENLELDIDGSLITRPPIEEIINNASFAERILLLGAVTFSGTTYIIGSNSGGVYYWISNAWTLITSTFQASAVIQYSNKAWLIPIPGSTNPGGSWDGSTFTAITAIPQGSACAIYKERLFVVPGVTATTNASRLTFSNAGDFSLWTGSDFIDISPGDGENLIDIAVYQDNLLLFKSDSIFVLAYATKPADAEVRNISTTLGATAQHCVASFENSVFFYHEGWVYEVVNYNFDRVSIKIPFAYDPTSPSSFKEEVFLSIFGDRLVCRYFNKIYVYGLRTRTWTTWSSTSNSLHYFGPIIPFPINPVVSEHGIYYAGSCVSGNKNMVALYDGYDSTTVEKDLVGNVTISSHIRTKNYDLANPQNYKKLNWWGADVFTKNIVMGYAYPVIENFGTLWSTLSSYTWSQLTGTWAYPLGELFYSASSVATGGFVLRRFCKYPGGFRYRQVSFKVSLTSSGDTADGPGRIYSLIIYTSSRAIVEKASN